MNQSELILTPDQRVRVFVSSTLEELADERAAVRRAVESLRLAPVMFELGARAHPPRSLYRSYLEQSHVFIALYWQRYGWVAPGMDISGLEDEYLLSDGKPRLVYVKGPAPDIEPRLREMLDRIRDEGGVSYKSFATPAELEQHVADDLALLLSEAFQVAGGQAPAEDTRPRLPAGPTPFIGRQAEQLELAELVRGSQLVTLTGPGGIGKTRLALQAAAQLAPELRDGAIFVPLAALHEPALVAAAIAQAVGVREEGPDGPLAALTHYLADRQLLLVLDNFEHLLDARNVVAEIIERSPGVRVLVTSREALRIRAEHEFPVAAMSAMDAVSLFAQRAGSVRHGYVIEDEDAATVDKIVERLEGVPLAIELAAARVRLLPPQTILQRLDQGLDFLAGGARDVPEHQRALRATLDWSYNLLDQDERRLLTRLGVFAGAFSLDAAESICGEVTDDVLTGLASLVDKSLLRAEPSDGEPRFRVLGIVRDYAREKLELDDELATTAAQHAEYYVRLSQTLRPSLRGAEQAAWVTRLGSGSGAGDIDNLRATLRWSIDHHKRDDVATIVWSMWLLAWISGRLQECRGWAREAEAADGPLSSDGRARLLTVAGLFEMWSGEYATSRSALSEAVSIARELGDEDLLATALLGLSMATAWMDKPTAARTLADEANALFRHREDPWGEATSYSVLTWFFVAEDDYESTGPVFDEALRVATTRADELNRAMIETNVAEYLMHSGDDAKASQLLTESLTRYRGLRALYPGAYALDATARLLARAGSAATATVLLGAADGVRAALSVPVEGAHRARREQLLTNLQHELGAAAVEQALQTGRGSELTEAIDTALDALGALQAASGSA